jgi:transcriptional regulator with XRE-family HTH domain
MNETTQLIQTIKRQLKIRGLSYRDVASALAVSEPSVKRLFANGRFTVDRLAQLSNLLGLTLAELVQEAASSEPRLKTLSVTQEDELVSDLKLLLVAVCALNHWTLDNIISIYQLSQAECLQRLLRLDRLRLIDLLPGNRVRVNVARDFDWLPSGPIRQFFQRQGQGDFLDNAFAATRDSHVFAHGMLTSGAAAQFQGELRRLRQKFSDLHEESLAFPLEQRQGMGLLMAMREWEPAGFTALRRQESRPKALT